MKQALFFLSVFLAAATATAQTDVSKYYLANPGFDSICDHASGEASRVAQEIRPVAGWTAALSADYTIAGVYEFGFAGTFNGAAVPSRGYDGEGGGALALSTGWEQTFCFSQSVTLPAGTYTVKVPTYNGSVATQGTSQLAWLPASGSAVRSTVSGYASGAWTLDQISFTLARTTHGPSADRLQGGRQRLCELGLPAAGLCAAPGQ